MSPTPPHRHEGGLSVRDQIERYRTAFISVITMIVIAVAVGGFILAHENLKLPSWVPVLGHESFVLKADFQTAQAVTPGQGQAVTIAGAKVGEVASVNLKNGVATVSMKVQPKYARFYRNATLLLRPKTQLQDITIEVNPGTPSAGKLKSGEVLPLAQTAPNINFDEFLAGLDAETREYVQELLAGAGEGLNHNSRALAATLKRFEPSARLGREIARELQLRQANIGRSIHNFRLLTEALGAKDQQIAQLVDASNAVFDTFSKEDANFQQTLKLLPSALRKTSKGLGQTAIATRYLTPALRKLEPFAKALGPSQEATKRLAEKTTPIIENEIRPFARRILPIVNELQPSTQALGETFPKLSSSFSVINEFFNELAYNPGAGKAGFVFFLDWANHDLNSVVSAADAHGVLGRTVVYLNCKILKVLQGLKESNPSVGILIELLKPPTRAECEARGLITAKASATAASAHEAGKPSNRSLSTLSGNPLVPSPAKRGAGG